jgi:putative heme-binding domain-containing protein
LRGEQGFDGDAAAVAMGDLVGVWFDLVQQFEAFEFGDDGGATGPDLTQAGGRFQPKDLVEAIVHPSKIVSDQYKATIVQTADGKVVTGRVVSESPEKITVVTDPEDVTKFVEILRSDIEELLPAAESLMPKGLLDQLNEAEVLDLLAYTLSRNNAKGPAFRQRK